MVPSYSMVVSPWTAPKLTSLSTMLPVTLAPARQFDPTTVSAPKWLAPVKGSATNAAVNEAAYTATATVGGSYVLNGSQYQYNWKTEKNMAGSYWRVGVSLDDGKTYYVNIALR